jgi:hypothetical protein
VPGLSTAMQWPAVSSPARRSGVREGRIGCRIEPWIYGGGSKHHGGRLRSQTLMGIGKSLMGYARRLMMEGRSLMDRLCVRASHQKW